MAFNPYRVVEVRCWNLSCPVENTVDIDLADVGEPVYCSKECEVEAEESQDG